MIEHIVLFKVRADVRPDETEELVNRFRRLPEEIPEIERLSFGTNFSDRSQGYTHGLCVRFADRAALAAYQVHPAHQAVVAEAVRPVVVADGILAVDYEV